MQGNVFVAVLPQEGIAHHRAVQLPHAAWNRSYPEAGPATAVTAFIMASTKDLEDMPGIVCDNGTGFVKVSATSTSRAVHVLLRFFEPGCVG